MDGRKRIAEIEQELEELSQKHLDLVEAQQQKFFLLRWCQPPNPELEAVNSEIAHLKEKKRGLYKALQAAALRPLPVPKKDWSNSFLYSQTLRRGLGAETPFDQYRVYISTTIGSFIICRSFFRSYHMRKAAEYPWIFVRTRSLVSGWGLSIPSI